jgi:hypothetical protein
MVSTLTSLALWCLGKCLILRIGMIAFRLGPVHLSGKRPQMKGIHL